MKRILLLLTFVFAVNLFAYSYYVEIEGREPDYFFSDNGYESVPVYLGFYPTNPDSLGIVKIKSPYNFTSIKVDGREVKAFNYSVTEAEINLVNYTSVYLQEVAHILEIYNEESRYGRLYFGSSLSDKNGCRLFCPYDISQATVLDFVPGVKNVYVPDEYWVNEEWCMPVVSIDKNAFLNDSIMESITIPSTLEWIGNNAFIGCTNLKKVVLENSPNPIFVPNAHLVNLFQDVPLESIYFGRLFSYRSGGAFSPITNKTSLESVAFGSDNMELPWNMFQGCTSIKSIIIPENVSIRPDYDPTHYGYDTPDRGIFAGCTSLEEVEILSPMTSTTIGMFMHCTSLKSVKLPCEIEIIAPFTFWDCPELPSFPDLPNITHIGASAFRYCLGFEDVILPEGVTTIGTRYAFGWCSNLKSIVLPPNIKELGEWSFDFCRNLEQVTYNSDNPKEFSSRMFQDCPSTKVLYVPGKSIEKFKEILPWKTFSQILPIPVPTQSVSLNVSECKINDGGQFQLQAIVMPEDATDELIWTSDNEIFVSVDSVGLVTAISVGDAVVSVKSGDFYASCNVSVVPTPAEGIILGMDSVNLKVGETINVEATVIPDNTTDKTIFWESSDSTVATVNETGEIKAVSIGTTVITATCGMVSAICEVTVIPTPVENISIGYESLNLQVGESTKLIASVSPEDATYKTVVWASDNESVAYVDEFGNVTATSLGTATITASCGDVSASCIVTVIATPAASISMSQGSAQLKVGESLTLTATVLPENATDKTVIWSSDNSMVASVDDYGKVTAMALGAAMITASCGDVSASCSVEVVATPAESLSLSQESAQMRLGETITLTAIVLPEDATDKTIVWSSDNVSVATVDEIGNVTAQFFGTATVTASCGEVSATCFITVQVIPVESVSISPESAELKVGENITLSAIFSPEDATYKHAYWSSDNPSVASVDDFGNVSAISLGIASIMVSCEDLAAYCSVSVVPTPAESIAISQKTVQLNIGESVALNATVLPEDATDKSVGWSSDNTLVATVDATGYVTAISLGTATITASCGDVSESCIVTVIATPVESILLSKESAQLKVGESLTLTATVLPENATDKTIVWISDNSMVAYVDEYGNVTAMSIGTATITASCGDVSESCIVTVIATPVESILLSKESAQLKVGESLTLTATVLPENATDKTIVWTSDNSMVAYVDEYGNVTAMSIGTATITASYGDVNASCIVTVVATPVEIISLSQETAQLTIGEVLTLSATVYPENATDKALCWSSSNESVATVDSEGNVTAIGIGEADIISTAADDAGISAVCHVTVNPVLVEAIILTPDNWSGEKDQSFRIDATVLPENATDKALWWASSDETVATVDNEGNVSVLMEGNCVITATAADGSEKFAKCTVTGFSGVDVIFTDDNCNCDIYDMNGLLLKKDCNKDNLKNLTPGIYILRNNKSSITIIVR